MSTEYKGNFSLDDYYLCNRCINILLLYIYMEKEIDEKQIIPNSLSEDSKINLKAYTWGYGKFGSIGINSFENKVVCPTILPFSLKLISYKCSIVNASAGMYSTIIVAQDGSIHGFGSNKNGRLGLQQDKEH